ncbi:MAG TPA: MFS transporter [Ferruginibacter sp.]|nr:MFS transporter [Ferruginibacter sp.]
MHSKSSSIFNITVLVAALGYFVDIYDLLLFGIVRKASLRSLGLSEDLVTSQGEFIIGVQMAGLLVGGIIWGVMGDKKGRLSVLFGSIVLYSVANIINGFVQTPGQYALIRFVAGVGLAGELGAGITLVSELVSKEKRGLSTSLVAGIGLTGAVFAYFISQNFDWRICYFIGGGLGFCLLLLRISVFESGLFTQLKEQNVQRGNFLMFFSNKKRFKKYLLAILIGLPSWYVIGVLITFSDKFSKAFGIAEEVSPAKATMYAYAAISVADVLTGLVSQWLRSRKKTLFIFYAFTIISIFFFFQQNSNSTPASIYLVCAALGFGTGFWAIFVTMAAEQFGTNLRATAATTVPNMVRGSLPIILLLFNGLQLLFPDPKSAAAYINAAWITGTIVMIISIVAAWLTEETFGKDLDYVEA